MIGYAPSIQRLIGALTSLPGIGEKTATRLALHILDSSIDEAKNLAHSIIGVKDSVKFCSICFNLSDSDPCLICSNSDRRTDEVCVVEEVNDLMALERSGFKGRYHVLHGVLSPLQGIGPNDIRINELVERVKGGPVNEVILATNPNTQGEATALYISKLLKPLGTKITRIAFGIPMGGDLEYVDEVTMLRSIEGRREI